MAGRRVLDERVLLCEHTTQIGGEIGKGGGPSLLTTLKVLVGGRQNRGRYTIVSFMLCDLLLEIFYWYFVVGGLLAWFSD